MELHEYETQFINGVNQTYEILKELDEVNNDDDFWKVYRRIEVGFYELETAMRNYYTELTKDGGDIEDCSLTHELYHGLYLLNDKYLAIQEKMEELSALPK
jgi:hypothetical protein